MSWNYNLSHVGKTVWYSDINVWGFKGNDWKYYCLVMLNLGAHWQKIKETPKVLQEEFDLKERNNTEVKIADRIPKRTK